MARSSRQKHRDRSSHKHRDRSDSEEEARASRTPEPTTERRRSRSSGDFPGENGRKLKDRREDTVAVVPDRWNGGGGGGGEEDGKVEKELKKGTAEIVDAEKNAKPRASGADLKGKSKGSSESEEKWMLEEESSRRDSSGSQYKDGKEREREREREQAREKYKKVQESRNERSDDDSRKGERVIKKDVVSSELQAEMRNPELEKELERRMKRRRDGSGDNDSLQVDGKESEAKRVSSKDEHSKNGSYKDERYKDGRYREKYRDDLDRDHRLHDDKRRDVHTSRIHASERSDNKHSRDENRLSESRYKTKVQDSDHDSSPHVDDRGTKLKDNRGRKRSSDEIEDSSDVKPQTMKESRGDTERNGSRSSKLDSHSDRGREHPHLDKVDSGLNSSCPKSSPGSSAYAVKDQARHRSRQTESSRRESLPEETCRPRTASREDHHGASGGRERVTESQSLEKTKLRDDIHSGVLLSEAAASHYDKTLRSGIHCSPNQLTEKSPTSASDRRSERTAARCSLHVEEVVQRNSSYKDGRGSSLSKDIGKERELPNDKLKLNGSSQADFLNSESMSLGPSSYNRTGNLQGTSPGHLLPQPPVRQGVDSSSGFGSYEDENRSQSVDRKPNSLYKRNSDVSAVRGGRKSNTTWSPAANGFMPLQHDPPAGFHPAVQQYPAPPIYCFRPSMDLNHLGVSYHPHDVNRFSGHARPSYHPHEVNRFSGHARPYGWYNSLDDCPPHLQLWDGSNNIFGDESHIYGRPDWDQNRHMMGNRGWEMSFDWNGQNGNMNTEFPVPRKEQEYSTQALANETWAGHRSLDKQAGTELTDDASGINRSSFTSPDKNALGTPRKSLCKKLCEPSTMLSMQVISEKRSHSYARFCCNYLSKLDISPDLVQPELYEQCMSSIGTGNAILAGNVYTQNNKSQDARVAAKSKRYFLNSRSPAGIDAVFQRAMSLYKKQKYATKEAMNPGLRLGSSQEDEIPSASDWAKANVNCPNEMEKDPTVVREASAFLMEVEEKKGTDSEGYCPEDKEVKHDCPSDTEEKGDSFSESVILAVGSEDRESLMPECMVNFSRIRSPESTH